jgi:ribosomal protein S18 acetylase RimI-like enzyme
MEKVKFSYATSEDANYIFRLFYQAFKNKFHTLLPENPEKGFYLYYVYFLKGLKKKKDKIILLKTINDRIIGFLALEGLGVPFISGNPSLTDIAKEIRLVGIKNFFRLFVGMLLIEGYPPSTNFLYINTIIIDSNYQGRGYGRKLIRLTEIIAKKRNFKGICLYVDSENKQALKFYEKLHFYEDSGFGGDFVENLIGVKYYSYQVKVLSELNKEI